MKAFTIPVLSSALVAFMSIFFFAGISFVLGDRVLAQMVTYQAIAAVVLIFCTPQSLVYMIGSHQSDEIQNRFSQSFTAEIVGISTGAAILAIALILLPSGLLPGRAAIILFYFSLAVHALQSCLGSFRAREHWTYYAAWNLTPNLVRVPLIWGTPWLRAHGLSPGLGTTFESQVFLYFLVPELVRFVFIALPLIVSTFSRPLFADVLGAAKTIFKNWIYDIGSVICDQMDKVVIAAVLGPQILVAYFYARRIGVAVSMVTEPFYAEQYRKLISRPSDHRHIRIYCGGLVLSMVLCAMLVGVLFLIKNIALLNHYIPDSVQSMFLVFLCVVFFDALLAANRWIRFVGQLDGGAMRILYLRLAVFGLYMVNISFFGNLGSGLGLVLSFALSWLIEAAYLVRRMLIADRNTLLAGVAA